MEINKIDLNSDSGTSSITSISPAIDTTPPSPSAPKKRPQVLLFIISALVLGVSSGAALKIMTSGSGGFGRTSSGIKTPDNSSNIKEGDVFGAKEESGFPDKAIGILEEGGLDGEGTHKLLRPNGPSQTVYLTSSILDMDEYVGYKITVWGETFSAQKAGWLMDVGRIKIEELSPTPFEE